MTAKGAALAEAVPAIERAAETAVRRAHEETLPTRVALRRGRGASVIAALALAGFLAIFGLVRTHRSEAFDLALTIRLQSRRHALLERLMTTASWLGFPPQSRIVPPAIIGTLGRRRYAPEVATYRSKRVRVESAHPLPCRADAQDLGTTPIEFVTLPRALRVVVPPADHRAPGAALPPVG